MVELSIVMCDDDKDFLKMLESRVSDIMNQNGYKFNIFKCDNSNELIKHCSNSDVDIILVDIDMPGIGGFEAVQKVQKIKPEVSIIFVTAHSEYAYQAYDYQPFCFVCKTNLERLNRALNQLIKKLILYNCTVVNLELDNGTEVEIQEVICFDHYKNNVIGHYENGQTISIRTTTKGLYEKIKNKGFVFVQRGYIANCRFVKMINSKYVVLSNGDTIPMTRDSKKLKEAQEIYGKYVREHL